jgi:hypothetical protein
MEKAKTPDAAVGEHQINKSEDISLQVTVAKAQALSLPDTWAYIRYAQKGRRSPMG